MNLHTLGRILRIGWKSSGQALLALILLASTLLIGPATPTTQASVMAGAPSIVDKSTAGKIDPRLLHMAQAMPAQLVRVIVQKLTPDRQLEQLAAAADATILNELPIINAFVAEMSAQAAVDLAQNSQVRWLAVDAQVQSSLAGLGGSITVDAFNTYLETLGIPQLAQRGLDGAGIGVAVIDSGIAKDADFSNVGLRKGFNINSLTPIDLYGHGTHIAGIVAGNGHDSNGKFKGIAPGVTLIGLKVSNDTGLAYESDVVLALQWTLENRSAYNIRVINLSINSGVDSSYHNSALNAAAEILWFNGVVVVVSAGNSGGQSYNTVNAPPANDPFVITVGASDELKTGNVSDDVMAPYSAYGRTQDGFLKPEIIAPGTGIYSVRASLSPWAALYPERLAYNGQYFRLSGTSMAAPMVVGVVALMLQADPGLTPDQVKYRLIHSTGRTLSAPLDGDSVAFPYMDGAAAVNSTATEAANTGLQPSQLLWSGSSPIDWESVNWNSVNWNSVNWNSVNWNSVNWNSVNWNSAVLEPPRVSGAGGLLPLAPGESWQSPAWPTSVPDVEPEPETPEQGNHLFLPSLGH